MRLPGEFMRKVEDSEEEPKVGEEGILHRVVLDNESYFAKLWRGKHYSRDYTTPLYYNQETDWKTAVSPFWFKVKYYEAQLINDVLPDLTLRIVSGADPRVSPAGKEFEFTKGRPMTVTKEVVGDTALRKERDEVIDATYKQFFAEDSAIWDEEGTYVGDRNPYDTVVLAARADREMQSRFGQYLDIRQAINGSTFSNQRNIDSFVRYVEEEYGDTDIEQMVKAGIIPVHAEFNYIPTKRVDENNTRGVFIEAAIFDPKRLARALVEKQLMGRVDVAPEDRETLEQEVEKKVQRYYILRKIDELWDQVYYQRKYNKETELLHDSEVAEALFRALDSIREKWDRENCELDNDFWFRCRNSMPYIHAHSEKGEVIESIKRFEDFVRNWQSK